MKYTITSATITIKDDMGEKNRVTFYADGRVRIRYAEGTTLVLNDKHPWAPDLDNKIYVPFTPNEALRWLQSMGIFIEPTVLRQTPKQEPGQAGGVWDDPEKGDLRKQSEKPIHKP